MTEQPNLQRGDAGWTPDPFHTAIAHKADDIRRDLYSILERNPDLEPGLAGRLATIAGKAGVMADIRWLEILEDAWRR